MFQRMIVAVITFAALLCSVASTNVAAAKSDRWLIYWYVCGTDIETSWIAFKPGTNLMSDDPNALMLADPDRWPGNATRSIKEVEAANLSPNVKIFMQAGGTYVWGHPKFRDLNAKIPTKIEVIVTDGKGNPAKYQDPTTKQDRYATMTGEYISSPYVGVRQWFLNKNIAPAVNGKIGRYLYDKHHRNWIAREQLPITSVPGHPETYGSPTDMGSQAGLVSFLQAGQRLEQSLYPDGDVRRVLIFVDHGGLNLSGVCFDQYTGDGLALSEIRDAFAEVQNGWTKPDEKPFEVVAFDACVMSSYETALAVENFANYMVASQEQTNILVGLGYTDLLNRLSENPAMSGAELGKVICDTYWDNSKVTDKEFYFDNKAIDTNAILTASVVDLSKLDALKTAYDNFGNAAFNFANQNPADIVQTVTNFKRAANRAEKYPAEAAATHFDSYLAPCLVDLKGFAKNVGQNIPKLKELGDELADAVNNAVVYQKRGDSLKLGGGLSTAYPFNLLYSAEYIKHYQQLAANNLASKAQGNLYGLLYNGILPYMHTVNVPTVNANGQQLFDQKTGKPLTHAEWRINQGGLLDLSRLADTPVDIDEDKKSARIQLDEIGRRGIEAVRCQLVYLKAFTDNDGLEKLNMLLLGGDSAMTENWQTGEFESTFRSKWIKFAGNLVPVQVVSDATKKNTRGKKIGGNELCLIPVQINGVAYKLFVSCEYPSEKFTIIGATPNVDAKVTLPSGELRGLQKGDVVTPLYSSLKISENGYYVFESLAGAPITIGDQTPKFELGALPDGKYAYIFEFVNPIGGTDTNTLTNNAFTKTGAVFTVEDGNVIEVQHFDDIEDIDDLR